MKRRNPKKQVDLRKQFGLLVSLFLVNNIPRIEAPRIKEIMLDC